MTKDEKIYKIIEYTIKNFEGGYVNDPADSGGPTNFGITQKVYDKFFNVKSSIEDIKNMKMSDAVKIYRSMYFTFNNIDTRYHEDLWHFIFDCYVQHGPNATGKIIQRALNSLGESLEIDGVIGIKTLEKIACHSPEDILKYMIEWRIWLYNQIVSNKPSQNKFLKGWLKRANWFKDNKL